MIIHNHQLSQEHILALDALVARCEEFDAGKPAYYRHLLLEKRTASNLLYYESGELLGCLAVFYFYVQDCEISLFIHPDHRRRGIGSTLLRHILPELIQRACQRMIFSCAQSQSLWIQALGLKKEDSEYQMVREAHTPLLPASNYLDLTVADTQDIPTLFAIDKACFTEQKNRSFAQFSAWLQQLDYRIFLASYQNHPVGKAHVRRLTPKHMILSDISILPPFQKPPFCP